jgi:hypothetical protein
MGRHFKSCFPIRFNSQPIRYESGGEFLLSTVLAVKQKKNGLKFAITDAGRL